MKKYKLKEKAEILKLKNGDFIIQTHKNWAVFICSYEPKLTKEISKIYSGEKNFLEFDLEPINEIFFDEIRYKGKTTKILGVDVNPNDLELVEFVAYQVIYCDDVTSSDIVGLIDWMNYLDHEELEYAFEDLYHLDSIEELRAFCGFEVL